MRLAHGPACAVGACHVLRLPGGGRARGKVNELLGGRPGIQEGVARLREAITRAEALFAMCDSPM
ncbi:MAG: hypothetical protein ACREUH_08155 [Burkholderiales bacterium]